MRWTPEQMDRLESACRRGLRVALSRRGTEYIVVARRVVGGRADALVGFLPMTGEELTFPLGELDHFEVLGQ